MRRQYVRGKEFQRTAATQWSALEFQVAQLSQRVAADIKPVPVQETSPTAAVAETQPTAQRQLDATELAQQVASLLRESLVTNSHKPDNAPAKSVPQSAEAPRFFHQQNPDNSIPLAHHTEDLPRLRQELAAHGIRLYPYPYSHGFAFSSDCDSCRIEDAQEYHELFTQRCGLPVGDSVFLIAEGPSLWHLMSKELQLQADNYLPFLYRGAIDTYHSFSAYPPAKIELLPADTRLPLDTTLAVAPTHETTLVRPHDELFPQRTLTAIEVEFDAPIESGVLSLIDDQGREHFATLNLGLGNRPGWEFQAKPAIDRVVIELFAERNSPEEQRIASLEQLRGICWRHGAPAVSIRRLSGYSLQRGAILKAWSEVAEQLNFAPSVLTDHMTSSFISGNHNPLADPRLMADNPVGPLYLTDKLPSLGLRFVNPANLTSEISRFDALSVITPSHLRDQGTIYIGRRSWDATVPEKFNDSSRNGVPHIIRSFLERTATEASQTFICYTHLGRHDLIQHAAFGSSAATAAQQLAERMYNFTGEVPHSQRVWVSRPGVMYRYAAALRGIAQHVRRESDTIYIDSWWDPIAKSQFATAGRAQELHGVTLYVADATRARVYVDQRETTSFTRNAPDETGKASITLVDDSNPLVLFDEVDWHHRQLHATNRRVGVETPPVRLDECVEYYLRTKNSPRGQFHGELVLTEDGRGTMTVDVPHFDASDTYHWRFVYRKSSLDSRIAVGFQTDDEEWHQAAEPDELDDLPIGWPLAPPHQIEWRDVVLDYAAQQGSSASPAKRPARKIKKLKFSLRGRAGDRFQIDRIEFLRLPTPEYDPGKKVLAGKVTPAQAGVPVRAVFGVGDARRELLTQTNANGVFRFSQLPTGVVVDLSASFSEQTWLAREGRYIELWGSRGDVEILLAPGEPEFDSETRCNTGELSRQGYGTVYVPRSEVISGGNLSVAQDWLVTSQVNNLGFLDRDRRRENEDRVPRVLILGTCMIEGRSTNAPERLNMQLERLLYERTGQPHEVLSGSFYFQDLNAYDALYDELFREFRPQVVVMSFSQGSEFLFNDWRLNHQRGGYDREHPPSDALVEDPKSQKLVRLKGSLDYPAFMTSPAKLCPQDDNWYVFGGVHWIETFFQSRPEYPPLVQQGVDHYVRLLRHYRDKFARDGVRLLFVMPTEVEAFNPDVIKSVKGQPCGPRFYAENIKAIFDQAEVPLLHLWSRFRHQPRPLDAHWPHDSHWSRVANRWAAEAIAEYLLAQDWLSTKNETEANQ